MRVRIKQEFVQLKEYYPEIVYKESAGEDWFQIPCYSYPAGWRVQNEAIEVAPIVFKVVSSYPTGEPYGFCVPAGINFNGTPPSNSGSISGVPFDGAWIQLSWSPNGWAPTSNARAGTNLLAWVRSFAQRLKEGA